MKKRLMSSVFGLALMAIAHSGAANAGAPAAQATPDALYEVNLCLNKKQESCETIRMVVSESSPSRYFRGTTFPMVKSVSVETDSAGNAKPATKDYQDLTLGLTVELQLVASTLPGGKPFLRYLVQQTALVSPNELASNLANLPLGASTSSLTHSNQVLADEKPEFKLEELKGSITRIAPALPN